MTNENLEIKTKREKKPFRFEFSAGGIVYRNKESSIKNKQVEILVVQHSGHLGWCFPKGLIDSGEKKEETALREVKEEGGVEAKIIKDLGIVEYFYVQEGVRVKKEVYYYLMEYKRGDSKDHDWEMLHAEWLPIDEVEKRLTFKNEKEIFQKAKETLQKVIQ